MFPASSSKPGVVGRPIARADGVAKVTGAATYAADADVPGVVHAVLVTSDVARGRIVSIDTGPAAGRGVLAVVTHRTGLAMTVPGIDAGVLKRFLPLRDDVIRHAGQPVAIAVAETPAQAQEAAARVVVRYDAQPHRAALADALDEAFTPPPGPLGPNERTRGDVAAGLAAAHVTVEAEYATPTHHHNPIEPSATVAVWDGDHLTVYESTQFISGTQGALAQAFGLPRANVRVISPYLGGGFGAKSAVWPHTILTAAVARHLRRPVKLVLSRADMYTSHGHRAETLQAVRLGAGRDGRLTAIDHVVTQQVSTTEEFGLVNGAHSARLLYACANVHTLQRAVRLDLPTGGLMRSPEAPTGHALECTMDELAYRLGIDPVELRLRNWTGVNPETGAPHGSNQLRECYRRGAERFGWSRRNPRPGSMRDRDGLIGWGMATAAHTAGSFGAAAAVTIGVDGSARFESGTQDIGTGTYTIMQQVGAQTLGLTAHQVTFALGDTRFPVAGPSAGSGTAASVGAAVIRAATAARDQVVAAAVADPGSPLHGLAPDQVGAADGWLFAAGQPSRRVAYRDVMRRHGVAITATTTPAPVPPGWSTGAVFVEVHVDPLLGRVRVRRVVGVFDTGRVLNRQTARSQAIGGAVWAIGFTLTEHTLIDPHLGRIVTPNLSGYLLPVNADIPDIDVDFVDVPDPTSPALGARGFGEVPMTGMTAAIGNAVFHAIGHRMRDLPITQDKILAALG
ncbi:xanthine dehydrogenase family protein molybdopterin-binding subunit [Catenuloplanes atrovinosus]|uniref:Xanthine dehydrogenase YagR molybdenum-binding subunit n=1 Tax=Catenuloplanes atrovinosus TaxID=137266 RepID=A0AAE3YIW1_9ACTN|nr:xanthine dehydrogenase family protein molybdopterin-binding subunit [Catenuloplanes atrovinosus]MDR7274310.1 xanthine dehydrogenase YagR molybdenum-binding subunit [Catenuloplanes atrovinosus]